MRKSFENLKYLLQKCIQIEYFSCLIDTLNPNESLEFLWKCIEILSLDKNDFKKEEDEKCIKIIYKNGNYFQIDKS